MSDVAIAGPRRDALTFGACGFALVVLFMGTNMPSPLYRLYQQEFGFSPLVVTLVFAVYVAVLIPALVLVGPLSDAVGRRRVLVPSLLLAIVGAAVFAGAVGTPWLFAARIVQGVSMALGVGAVSAALVESEPAGDRARAGLVATACIIIGAGLGPLLAGVLAEYAPWPRRLVFIVEIAALAVALLGVCRLPATTSTARWRPQRPRVPASIRVPFITASVTSFLAWAITALFLTLVPSYALALADSSNSALAGAVVALLFVGALAVAVRGVGDDHVRGQQRGLGLLIVGMALLVVAGESSSLPLLLVATVVAGVGQGLAFLAAMTAVNTMAPAGQLADVMSSFSLITYLGTGVPVIGVGVMATRIDVLTAVEAFAAGLAVACLLALVRTIRVTRRPAVSAASRRPSDLGGHSPRSETVATQMPE